jgi:hypothetical protein
VFDLRERDSALVTQAKGEQEMAVIESAHEQFPVLRLSIYELEVGWAETVAEQRYLRWELLACDHVLGAFATARERVLAVLFTGGRRRFYDWARALAPEHAR